MIITFNELRRFKDSLPHGTMHRIAKELAVPVETVRNYFGGSNYKAGNVVGISIEQGPDGGYVLLEDTRIYDMALEILKEQNLN